MPMTRKRLASYLHQRRRFAGEFVRFGKIPARYWWFENKTTLLFRDIVLADTGRRVADHIWLVECKGLKRVYPLEAGDVIYFDARVGYYQKSGVRHYKLTHPTNVSFRPPNC
jgi:hypothetical protein